MEPDLDTAIAASYGSGRGATPAAPSMPPTQRTSTDGPSTERELLARARRRAAMAGAISTELSGSLNLRRTVLRILDLVRPMVADWAMIALADTRNGKVTLHGGDVPAYATALPRVPSADLGLGRVLRSGQSELLHVALEGDVESGLDSMIPHDRLRAEAAGLRPADVLGVALTARGVTIGVLVLVRGAGSGFDADDVALAEQIAGRAAVALDSARLYEERSEVAEVLQAGLRPPALPVVPGLRLAARFRAAAEHIEIGGDFYDVHGADDDWLVVLGDVCGKGVEAAVLTGRARQSIRTATHFDRSPAGVLTALNDVLYEADSDRFVTVVCGRLRPAPDGSGADVELAVAGHQAPLIVRADGSVADVEVSGTVAGVLPHVRYTGVGVRIEPGDTMLMFTDGIHEARGDDGGPYGMERLRALLAVYAGAAPDVLCEAVEQDVVEHLNGRAHDDMAVFAVACGR